MHTKRVFVLIWTSLAVLLCVSAWADDPPLWVTTRGCDGTGDDRIQLPNGGAADGEGNLLPGSTINNRDQDRGGEDLWIVVFRNHAAKRSAMFGLKAAPRFDYQIIPAVAVPLSDDEAAAVLRRPEVAYLERDQRYHALAQTVPYGIEMVGGLQSWPISRGAGARVAVLDTGIALAHPDLPAPVAAESFVTGEPVDDGYGHGSHISGTVCATDNDFGVVGVAPDADLMIGKVLDDSGSGTLSAVIAGIDWAAGNGADVIEISLGSTSYSQAMEDAVDAAWAAGVVVVAPAGNNSSSLPVYPGAYPNAISVVAVDEFEAKADFSNYGPTVDLAAPGVQVLSTVPFPVPAASAEWDGVPRDANPIDGTSSGSVSGGVYYCGFGTGTSSADSCPSGVAGNIAHIRRGVNTFADKVEHAYSMGAVGVIVSNNEPGNFQATLDVISPLVVVSVSQADGDDLMLLGDGEPATIEVIYDFYAEYNGTSMASAHVAGVAALLVACADTGVTAAQIRGALENTAKDLGAAGRDDTFGYGLVNAEAALAMVPGCQSATGDWDGDGVADPIDNCPNTYNPDQADNDNDGFGDLCDGCPTDPEKTDPGICGCEVADTDSDGDDVADCEDGCPSDPLKIDPGACGCGVEDTDSDGDGTADCNDGCPLDPAKVEPGVCGCGQSDSDADGDGVPDCVDMCPFDPFDDADGDGVCGDVDRCPDSDMSPTVVILGCSSGVANLLLDGECTTLDEIWICAGSARNHDDFVECVSHLTNTLLNSGLISGRDKGMILRCAGRAGIP